MQDLLFYFPQCFTCKSGATWQPQTHESNIKQLLIVWLENVFVVHFTPVFYFHIQL